MKTASKTYYRRNLPHWHPDGAAFFVTWRLHGSLPRSSIEQIEARRNLLRREAMRKNETTQERNLRHDKKLFAMIDEILDKTDRGPLWLKQPPIADLIEEALLNRYAELYRLWAYVVMANHVHVLLQPKLVQTDDSAAEPGYIPLEEITKRLKGYTAREANKMLRRTGNPFWQVESYDHWERDEAEFYRIVSYIENNPVKAGLALRPEDWKWSSARERLRRGWTEIRALT